MSMIWFFGMGLLMVVVVVEVVDDDECGEFCGWMIGMNGDGREKY